MIALAWMGSHHLKTNLERRRCTVCEHTNSRKSSNIKLKIDLEPFSNSSFQTHLKFEILFKCEIYQILSIAEHIYTKYWAVLNNQEIDSKCRAVLQNIIYTSKELKFFEFYSFLIEKITKVIKWGFYVRVSLRIGLC